MKFKHKFGELVSVRLPNGKKVYGTILRMSPDRRLVVIRLDNNVEMMTETRFLKTVKSA